MLFANSLGTEDRWECLQQPAHPSAIEPQFRILLAAIDMGWRIDEPVYLRPRWSDSGPRVYHFILRRALLAAPRMLSVLQGSEVDRFVRDGALRLVVGRRFFNANQAAEACHASAACLARDRFASLRRSRY